VLKYAFLDTPFVIEKRASNDRKPRALFSEMTQTIERNYRRSH
jgi:hypothetical protein